MLKVRIIPCLDVDKGRVVKGISFVNLVDAGDPVEQARRYDAEGADELCFLDITASHEARDTLYDIVARTASQCFMPLTVGGGVRKACRAFPGRVAVGIDARDGKVAVAGWAEATQLSVHELATQFEDAGVSAIIYTDIERDGAMQGPNIAATVALAQGVKIPIIASGGVSSLADLEALKAARCPGIEGVISGRALYDGRLDPASALKVLAC